MGSELVAVLVSASHDATGPGFKALGRHLHLEPPAGAGKGPPQPAASGAPEKLATPVRLVSAAWRRAAAAVFYSKLARHW